MSIFSRIIGVLFVLLWLSPSVFAADAVSGRVQNLTTNRPAAGDDVVLLRLGEGMEEVARTRADAAGAFTLAPPVAGSQHIVRVIHQGVVYDQAVSGQEPVRVGVFDAVARIPGVSGKLGIVKVESDGGNLKVTEMYSIENSSAPPVTQVGPRNFEYSLPSEAKLDSFQAERAGGVWVNLAPLPVKAQKNGFAVDFPLRPGETLFRFTYHLPYDGHATFHVKLAYPIEKLGVVHPPSLIFKALRARSFTSPGQVQGMQLEQAVAQPVAGDVPAFEISGAGAAPETLAAQAALQQPPAPAAGDHQGVSSAPRPQSQAQVWLVLSGIAAILTIGAAGWWRGRRVGSAAVGLGPPLMESLQEELYQLELDRLHGSISDEQYQTTRQALDVSLKRAATRGKS